jgi:hypothetical protein
MRLPVAKRRWRRREGAKRWRRREGSKRVGSDQIRNMSTEKGTHIYILERG